MKIAVTLLLLVIASRSPGDSVMYETNFTEEPDDWYNTGFVFGPDGAVFDYFSFGDFDLSLCTGDMPPAFTIFIPDGADSVAVEVDHTLEIAGGEWPSISVNIQLGSNEYPMTKVWEVVLNHYNPGVYGTFAHSFSPAWLQGGQHLGIHFRMDAISDDLGSSYYWNISHLKVTVYGDQLALPQSTWGDIKSSLQ